MKKKIPNPKVPLWYNDAELMLSFTQRPGYKKVTPRSPIGFTAYRYDSAEETYSAWRTMMQEGDSPCVTMDRATCTLLLVHECGDEKDWVDLRNYQHRLTLVSQQRVNQLANAIAGLLEWEAHQGGYEAPAWKHAKKLLKS
jgi:hypothetical protein